MRVDAFNKVQAHIWERRLEKMYQEQLNFQLYFTYRGFICSNQQLWTIDDPSQDIYFAKAFKTDNAFFVGNVASANAELVIPHLDNALTKDLIGHHYTDQYRQEFYMFPMGNWEHIDVYLDQNKVSFVGHVFDYSFEKRSNFKVNEVGF